MSLSFRARTTQGSKELGSGMKGWQQDSNECLTPRPAYSQEGLSAGSGCGWPKMQGPGGSREFNQSLVNKHFALID